MYEVETKERKRKERKLCIFKIYETNKKRSQQNMNTHFLGAFARCCFVIFFSSSLESRELWMKLIEFIRFEANKCKLNNFGANFCFLSHYYGCVCVSYRVPHKPTSKRWRTLNENFIPFCCKRNGHFHFLIYMRREQVAAMCI